jgi:hypothetical protein
MNYIELLKRHYIGIAFYWICFSTTFVYNVLYGVSQYIPIIHVISWTLCFILYLKVITISDRRKGVIP